MNFKEYISEAIKITTESAGHYLTLRRALDENLHKIDGMRELSEEGKRMYKDKARDEARKELAKISGLLKRTYKRNLTEARKDAEKILSKATKPSDAERQAFTEKVRELKVHLALTPDPVRAKQQLDDFLRSVDNDITAQLVRESFADLAGSVVARLQGQEAGRASLEYRTMYDTLATKFKSDEYKAAAKALETISSLENGRVFPLTVETNAREAFGVSAVDILHNPERYEEVAVQ
jgi:vacuolar-type H+-ATPase subunit H